MAKTMLNQTMSRPILYAYAQEQIAKTPSKWLDEKTEKIQEFLACIPKIKELVKNKISSLYPKEELAVLKKYELTNQESCFWFTDQDTEDEGRRNNDRSIYANFDCKGYGGGYRYGSSKKEIGNLSRDDLIALYYEDMVANGIDVVKYKFVEDNGCDYNGKKISPYHQEVRQIKDKIDAYQSKFFEDNDMAMEFTMPNSNYSCYQRAQLVTPEEYQTLMIWNDKLESIRLKWHKHYGEMKEKFKAYAELIRSSKNLEGVIEIWSEAENVRHKITGTGTALALSSISESVIQQDMLERQAKDKVAVIVTPTENVWGNA
jgi:hypothetical protein